jgi:hypothetical protein
MLKKGSTEMKATEGQNLVCYIFDSVEDRERQNAIALFVYENDQTKIYGKPGTRMFRGLARYSEKIRKGETPHTPLQQFVYLTWGALPPPHLTVELTEQERELVDSILENWADIDSD